jgi:hypothetical protein
MLKEWSSDKIISMGLVIVSLALVAGDVAVQIVAGQESMLASHAKEICIGLAGGYMGTRTRQETSANGKKDA